MVLARPDVGFVSRLRWDPVASSVASSISSREEMRQDDDGNGPTTTTTTRRAAVRGADGHGTTTNTTTRRRAVRGADGSIDGGWLPLVRVPNFGQWWGVNDRFAYGGAATLKPRPIRLHPTARPGLSKRLVLGGLKPGAALGLNLPLREA